MAGEGEQGLGGLLGSMGGIGKLAGGISQLSDMLGSGGILVEGLGGLSAALGPVGMAVVEAGKQLIGMARAAAEFAYALATAVVWIPRAVEQFTKALDPVAVERFDAALASVNATIGQAFVPMTIMATKALRTMADMIAPTFERLKEPVEAVTQAFLSWFLPGLHNVLDVVDLFVDVLKNNAGAIAAFGQWMGALSESFGAVIALVKALAETLLSTDTLFTNVFDGLAQSAREVTKSFVAAAATVLKFLGLTATLDAFKKALDPRREGRAKLPAPTDFGITDVAGAMREQTIAAARASVAQGAPRDTNDILNDLSGIVENVAQNGLQIIDIDKVITTLGTLVAEMTLVKTTTLAILEKIPKPPTPTAVATSRGATLGGAYGKVRGWLARE